MKPVVALAIGVTVLAAQTGKPVPHSVTAVRHWSLTGVTRIAVEVSGEFQYRSDRLQNPDRIYYDILNARPNFDNKRLYTEDLGAAFVKRIRVAETLPGVTRVVLDLDAGVEAAASVLSSPDRLIIELRGGAVPAVPTAPPVTVALPLETAIPGLVKPAITPAAASAQGQSIETARPVRPTTASASATTQVQPLETARPVRPATASASTTTPVQPLEAARPVRPATASASTTTPVQPLETARPVRPTTASASTTTPVLPLEAARPVKPTTVSASTSSQAPPIETARAVKPDVLKAEAVKPDPAPPVEVARPAHRTAAGGTSLVRALGLKLQRVVIDPGHGGHDEGAQGPKGLLEKDLVLDVAMRLGKLIEDRMGAEVIYTRSDDTFVPLEGRTALANDKKADLFLSIHANSSPTPHVTGVETYYVNFTDSKDAIDVASRENASSQKSVFELRDIIERISAHDKAEESRDFASRIQTALFAFSSKTFTAERNRGVRKAPFVVLIGASMPSVLVEIGFLSNSREEALLNKPEYRQKLAEALFRGLTKYAEGLSHFQVAEN
jgi:N-acetylmuramoyl-L-alanine amidase